jgi:hypothetical protein
MRACVCSSRRPRAHWPIWPRTHPSHHHRRAQLSTPHHCTHPAAEV